MNMTAQTSLQGVEKLWNSNFVKLNIANFLLFFSFYLLLPLLPIYMSETFSANKHVIGAVLSGYTITALLSRPFSGYIVDTFSRKKVLLIVYFLFFVFFAGYFLAGTLLLFTVIRTLHGAPFGAVTVSNSTMAIDSLPSARRAEGIGYYGLSNNVAMALGPTVAMWLYTSFHDFNLMFALSLITAGIGFTINTTLKPKTREVVVRNTSPISLDRFFLLKGWAAALTVVCLSFSYGVLSTYIAIYGMERLGITTGTGTYFCLLAAGLVVSRLIGSKTLRQGKIVLNASLGIVIALIGFFVFAAVETPIGYYSSAIIIGLGNGHMFPAMQNIFINLAKNNQRGTANATLLTSWDCGVGLGVFVGGVAAEIAGYNTSFWISVIVNAIGALFFFTYVKTHFNRNRLR